MTGSDYILEIDLVQLIAENLNVLMIMLLLPWVVVFLQRIRIQTLQRRVRTLRSFVPSEVLEQLYPHRRLNRRIRYVYSCTFKRLGVGLDYIRRKAANTSILDIQFWPARKKL